MSPKNSLKKLISVLGKLAEKSFRIETRLSKRWAASSHKRLFASQWRSFRNPEWFEHNIDLYFQWVRTGNPMWIERGVFSSLAVEEGSSVLDLCCGDGFYSANFYSYRAANVVACDFDERAIQYAKSQWRKPNLRFDVMDIRNQLPDGRFDNVIWDAAIEHFTQSEIAEVLLKIKARMYPHSILSGYTIVERKDGTKSLDHHEYEFKSKEELLNLLSPYFQNVQVFETFDNSRHNLYFWASDDSSKIPFSDRWLRGSRTRE